MSPFIREYMYFEISNKIKSKSSCQFVSHPDMIVKAETYFTSVFSLPLRTSMVSRQTTRRRLCQYTSSEPERDCELNIVGIPLNITSNGRKKRHTHIPFNTRAPSLREKHDNYHVMIFADINYRDTICEIYISYNSNVKCTYQHLSLL